MPLRLSRLPVSGRAELDLALSLRKLPARNLLADDDLDLGAAQRLRIHQRLAPLLWLVTGCKARLLPELRLASYLRERAHSGRGAPVRSVAVEPRRCGAQPTRLRLGAATVV